MPSEFTSMNSGIICLIKIGEYYKRRDKAFIRAREEAGNITFNSLLDISRYAEKMGFRTRIVSLTYKQLLKEAPLPCIVRINKSEPVVLMPSKGWTRAPGVICENARGEKIPLTKQGFVQQWIGQGSMGKGDKGIALLLEPMPEFNIDKKEKRSRLSWRMILQYFKKNRKQLIQLAATLLITSLLQLIFPFLTQSLVDIGIETKDLNYIDIILIAQLTLVFSRVIVDFIRGHLLLYMSAVVNLSILSDFWIKLTHLPIAYFDQGRSGEILQRISDNKQIQNFFTGPAINTLFAIFNFIVFAIVLSTYKMTLFFVFMGGVILYFLWMMLFLKIRRKLNYQLFHLSSRENNSTLQLVQGMQEIKLLNIEQSKRWEWENIQGEMFVLNFRNLSIGQIQRAGAVFINQGKDILLTFLVANQVVQGHLTFGALLAIQYIIGQLTGPVEQFIGFVQDAQTSKISIDRLNEVHQLDDEAPIEHDFEPMLPANGTISIRNLGFSYPGEAAKPVFQGINLEIPEGKITAIVGISGSGKTTLLKLLLKFHDRYTGQIQVNETDFRKFSPTFWRNNCAAVLQDGYIFNDSIERNIAFDFEQPHYDRLLEACKIANILSFIESLPEGFNTRLGVGGVGISQGQKQRLLIARAVYKNAKYVFFDESTNALDANTEMAIVENLKEYFKDRTVVIVAHRLSTVKNADNIVVLHSGEIKEQGNHTDLSRKKGRYYELVKNQLELGI
ncbi:MAG TPA: peptidase domain-containing ABC transporter [Puia sp.]|nr:peptidase domain-containing ABC transporter [Puia sp.]